MIMAQNFNFMTQQNPTPPVQNNMFANLNLMNGSGGVSGVTNQQAAQPTNNFNFNAGPTQ